MIRDLIRQLRATVSREGPTVALRKIGRRLRYVRARVRNPHVPEEAKWKSLRGRFEDQRVFLVGNGPSLNKLPLHLLRDERTLCFNRFNIMLERLVWRPDFYMSVDDLVLSDLVVELPRLLAIADHFFFPDIHFRGTNYFDRIGPDPRIWWMRTKLGRGFSTRMPDVYRGGSVIYEGLQVLTYLGFDEIFLIGVDMDFQTHGSATSLGVDGTSIRSVADDDPNHFDPRYFGRDRQYHQPETYVVRHILDSLEHAASAVSDLKVRVFNAGVDSRVESFPRREFRSLFSHTSAEEIAIIDECIASLTSFDGLSDLRGASDWCDPASDWSSDFGTVSTSMEAGVRWIKHAVFTHLPLGPFEGCYYFIPRWQLRTG